MKDYCRTTEQLVRCGARIVQLNVVVPELLDRLREPIFIVGTGSSIMSFLGVLHAALSTCVLAVPTANYFLNAAALTRVAAAITFPALLPVFPLTVRRWGVAKSKPLLAVLNVGAMVNLYLSYRVLAGHAIPIRLEIALIVSNLGAVLLNGKLINAKLPSIRGSVVGRTLLYFGQRPLLSGLVAEGLGVAMLLHTYGAPSFAS